jgi:hypothetical protein
MRLFNYNVLLCAVFESVLTTSALLALPLSDCLLVGTVCSPWEFTFEFVFEIVVAFEELDVLDAGAELVHEIDWVLFSVGLQLCRNGPIN